MPRDVPYTSRRCGAGPAPSGCGAAIRRVRRTCRRPKQGGCGTAAISLERVVRGEVVTKKCGNLSDCPGLSMSQIEGARKGRVPGGCQNCPQNGAWIAAAALATSGCHSHVPERSSPGSSSTCPQHAIMCRTCPSWVRATVDNPLRLTADLHQAGIVIAGIVSVGVFVIRGEDGVDHVELVA